MITYGKIFRQRQHCHDYDLLWWLWLPWYGTKFLDSLYHINQIKYKIFSPDFSIVTSIWFKHGAFRIAVNIAEMLRVYSSFLREIKTNIIRSDIQSHIPLFSKSRSAGTRAFRTCLSSENNRVQSLYTVYNK